MNKTYDITGLVQITFYSNKPHALVLERSRDYGVTWLPYRYYADSCQKRFPGVIRTLKDLSSMETYCLEDPNIQPTAGTPLTFQAAYTASDFWLPLVQRY